MKLLLILLLIFEISCSSRPTAYVQSTNDNKGYSDETIGNDLRLATFQGNAETKKEDAELFAKFRAIEVCRELGKTYTHILVVKDKSFSKDIAYATTSGPSYYYGMSPYYGRGMGMSMSYGTGPTSYTSETYTYPFFEAYFECTEKPMDARVSLINLSSSQMEKLVKDLQGAVQVDEVLADSPNLGKIKKGDIIIKADGERVEKVIDLYKASRKALGRDFKVEFYRNGSLKQATVSFKDVSQLVGEVQDEIIKRACKKSNMGKVPICK